MVSTSTVIVTFPDGSEKEYPKGTTCLEVAKSISEGLARAAIAAKLGENIVDLSTPINHDAPLRLLKFEDDEGLKVFRHSSAHVLAHAVRELFPYAKPTIGPVVEEGFYYDFDHEPFSPEDLLKIEKRMEEIVARQLPIERKVLNKKQACELFKDNPYKIEIIESKDTSEVGGVQITAYKQGDFIDLCRGPHVPNTGVLKAIKLIKLAGAYWRANQKNKQLQRIYGISFPDKKQLADYLKMLEEAKKRDHRILGKQLDLFEVSEDVGPGLIFWLPKGNIIKEELEDWAKETEKKWGYQRVTTPLITKEGIFYTSEHLPHYKESMYAPMKIDNDNYYIKPMNCPFHHTIYACRKRSYRELPLRLAEYGWCHRFEDSGALMGMMRVRGMQMNDAHIYCTKQQAIQEFVDVIRLHQYYYEVLGIAEYWMELCLRNTTSTKYHGDDAMWKEAEDLMKKAMDLSGVKYVVQNDGAAFYGPKIDFQIKSATGRIFTASTNQIDLFMPKKFRLVYTAEDGKEHTPAVIHRAPLGTHERFVGFLIEHFAGKFPLWLNPVHVKLLTVADRHIPYAEILDEKFVEAGIRVEVDSRAESIPKKIREAQLSQANYILVVGDADEKDGTVTVRTRDNVVHGPKNPDAFLKQLLEEIRTKKK
ncbi:threonine--tRNA ligase [Candidatus Woesearchaeota archaeon]|nr:threonine--tRNA ligase [Candidatus Woesearchaeota archaeon]